MVATISLTPSTVEQVVIGLEATAQTQENDADNNAGDQSAVWSTYQSFIQERAVNWLGLSRLRLEIKQAFEASDGDPISTTRLDARIDSTVTPLRTLLAARGESLWVTLASAIPDTGVPVPFADAVVGVYQHIQSTYGWLPDAFEIVEPLNTCTYTLASYKTEMRAIGDALD